MKNINKTIGIIALLFVLFAGLFLIPQRATAALPFPTLTVIDVPDSIATTILGINGDSKIVGFFGDSSGGTPGFLLDQNGNFTTIDVPDSIFTDAVGITKSGEILGNFVDSDDVGHGFLLDKSGNFTTIDVPGSFPQVVFHGINPSGNKIVGFFVDCGFSTRHGFLLTLPK